MLIKYDWGWEGKVRNVFHSTSCIEPDSTLFYSLLCNQRRQPLTSSGSTILSWPWENCHDWFSSFQKNFKSPHPLTCFLAKKLQEIELLTSTLLSMVSHGNLLTLSTAVSPFPLPFPPGSHTHWIRKVNLNTSVHISGMHRGVTAVDLCSEHMILFIPKVAWVNSS